MSYPKQPGQDAAAHRRLAEDHLVVLQERDRLRAALARLVDALERNHGGSVLLSSTVLAEMDAAKALLASPPQAAAQTGERDAR